jgi:hypothetical protein
MINASNKSLGLLISRYLLSNYQTIYFPGQYPKDASNLKDRWLYFLMLKNTGRIRSKRTTLSLSGHLHVEISACHSVTICDSILRDLDFFKGILFYLYLFFVPLHPN